MKTCRISLILLFVFSAICCNKEVIGQQLSFDGITLSKLTFMPDSLKTTEQKELELKMLRVYHTNIKFRGDSIAFILDKDDFLFQGLLESAYLEFMYILRQFNHGFRNATPEYRQRLLSNQATDNAVMLNFFAMNFQGRCHFLSMRT